MAIWIDSEGGQWTDVSTDIWTDKDLTELLVLEDVRLNLAAFHQSLEDIPLEIAASYQSIEDAAIDLLIAGWSIEDVRAYLLATSPIVEDARAHFDAIGRAREDAASLLQAIAWATDDFRTYLEAGSATVLADLCGYFEVTDGQAFSNAATWLAAIRQPPAFRSTVAQRLSSVVSAATWMSIADVAIRLEASAFAAEDAGVYLEAIAA